MGPRLGLHILPDAVDLARFTVVSVFVCRVVLSWFKILFIQKLDVFFGFVYSLFRIISVNKAYMFKYRV